MRKKPKKQINPGRRARSSERSPRRISLAKVATKEKDQFVARLLAANPSLRGAVLEAVFCKDPEALNAILAMPKHRERILARIAEFGRLDAKDLVALLAEKKPLTKKSREQIFAQINDAEWVKRFGPMTEPQIRHAIYRKKQVRSDPPEIPEGLRNLPTKTHRS